MSKDAVHAITWNKADLRYVVDGFECRCKLQAQRLRSMFIDYDAYHEWRERVDVTLDAATITMPPCEVGFACDLDTCTALDDGNYEQCWAVLLLEGRLER